MNKKIYNKLIRLAVIQQNRIKDKPKHFSFLIKRNKIICYGWNKRFKTHPKAALFQCRFAAIHSELDVINNFGRLKDLKKCTLVNIRLKKGQLAISKPCQRCQQMLIFFGINDIIYSVSGGFYG